MLSTNFVSEQGKWNSWKSLNARLCDGDLGIIIPLRGLGEVQGIAYLARKQAFQDGHVSAFIACISLNYFSFSNLLFLCFQIVIQKI